MRGVQVKKKYIYMLVVFLLATGVIGTSTWGYYQYQAKEEYYQYIDNQTKRKYYDLVGSIETISSELSKLMVSTQTKENMVLFSRVWQNAYNAEEYLSQLPINQQGIIQSNKFLNQLGDYTFAMAQKSIEGEKLSTEDVNNLQQLYEYAVNLSMSLREIEDEAVGGEAWRSRFRRQRTSQMIDQKTEEVQQSNPVEAKFTKFEERMNLYPELIYDGPFSEHVIQGIKPKLRGAKITAEEAEKRAREFISEDRIQEIEQIDGMKGQLVTFNFKVTQKEYENPLYIDITEVEGYTAYVLNNREIEQANISRKQAIEIANQFLQEKGFQNMMPTYSLKTENTAVINYAYVQKDVVMYPDLIKVKVALDNGDIIGFDSTHYLTLNEQRDITEPKITPEEARQNVSVRANIEEAPQLCYIPTSYGKEVYCYEVKVTRGNEHFLIYINANTGIEEKILKAIISENGTLMI